jgi:predicted permease
VIVGVMPADFAFPSRATQLWTPGPLNPADTAAYRAGMLTMVGHLAPGVSTATASEELRRLRHAMRSAAGVMGPFDPAETRVIPLRDQLVGSRKATMLLVAGIVGIVLLIACANVANLMLLRGITRRRGVAVRVALGASRAALMRASLVESITIALAGGLVGLGVALWTYEVLARVLAADAPMIRRTGLDPLLLGVTFLITGVTAVAAGLVPALRASGVDFLGVLREGGRGDTERAWPRGALVISELALAFVLATVAGLLLKSLWTLQHVDPGFQTEHVLSLRVSPPSSRYSDSARVLAYWRVALGRVRAVPGATEAGAIHLTPMGLNNWNPDLVVEGEPAPRPGESRSVDWRVATPDYFRTMGIPLVRGRGFTEQDRYGAPVVAIVNATLAKAYFGSADPVGKRVRTAFEGDTGWATVIGEVGDVHGHGLAADPVPEIYRPFDQFALESMTLMVRVRGDPAAMARSVRQALVDVDPSVIIDEVRPMRDVVADSVAGTGRVTWLLLGFGLLALTLAATGVFGVVSFAVASRTRELGIRLALGASGKSIMVLVLRQGALLAGAGTVVGSLLALAAGSAVRSQLYRVPAHDPTVTLAALGTLLLVVLLATCLPALRATRVDPVAALRNE